MEDIEAGREVCTFCLHERDEEPAKCSATGQPVYFRSKQSKVVESKVPGVSRSTCCAHTDRTVVKQPQRWANDCTERERERERDTPPTPRAGHGHREARPKIKK
jgi:hypothetical protein